MSIVELLSQEQVNEFILQDETFKRSGAKRLTFLNYQYNTDEYGRKYIFCRVLADNLHEKSYELHDDSMRVQFREPSQSELFRWLLFLTCNFGEEYLKRLQSLMVEKLNYILASLNVASNILPNLGAIDAIHSKPQNIMTLGEEAYVTIEASLAYLKTYAELASPEKGAIFTPKLPENCPKD